MRNQVDRLLDLLEAEAKKPVVVGYVSERKPGRPGVKWTQEQRTDIANRYIDGQSLDAIGRDYRVRGSTIKYLLVQAGVRIRKQGRPRHTWGAKHRNRMRSLKLVMDYLSSRRAPRIRVAGQPAAAVLQTIYVEMARRSQ